MSSKSFQNASKLNGIVSVLEFGAVGDGATDDTAAIQAAIDSLGAAGGTVTLANDGKYLVGALIIKSNVRLKGNLAGLDATSDNINFSFSSLGSALQTQALTTITLMQGSAVEGIIFYPQALLPNVVQSNASTFTGTALTAAGYGVEVSNCLILGYNIGFSSTNLSRQLICHNSFDCQNAIFVSGSYDTTRILHNQCWPFLTHTAFWNSGNDYASRDKTKLYRSGSGLTLKDASEDTRVDGNLFYGFLYGIELQAVTAANLGSNWIDHPPGVNRTGNRGIYFRNNVTSIIAQTLFIFGARTGISMEMNASEEIRIDELNVQQCDEHAVSIANGSLYVNSFTAKSIGGRAISVSVNSSIVKVLSYSLANIGATQPVAVPTSAYFSQINLQSGYWDGAAGASLYGVNPLTFQIVASVDPLALPCNINSNIDVFRITGTTGFGNITGGWGGRRVVLVFTDALTIFDGAVINISGNFTTTANDIIELIHDGFNWLEVGRSVN